MTTSHSPLRILKAQADNMAKMLKAAERGEKIANDPAGRIAASRKSDGLTFAVAMDDKMLKIQMTWATIRVTSKQMRGQREAVQ